MLAKGKKSVNGKCVLLCTLEETTGRKITILTASHAAAVFVPGLYPIENKAQKYLFGCADILSFKLRVRAVLKPGYLVNVP